MLKAPSGQARSSVAERSYYMGEVKGSIPFRAYHAPRPIDLAAGPA